MAWGGPRSAHAGAVPAAEVKPRGSIRPGPCAEGRPSEEAAAGTGECGRGELVGLLGAAAWEPSLMREGAV